jgi:hypothetical protein
MKMNVDEARSILTGFPGSVEGAHHGHPDFRVGNKIFATLWPTEDRSVLRLDLERAEAIAAGSPERYRIVSRSDGVWVSVTLPNVEVEDFQPLAETAYRLRQP